MSELCVTEEAPQLLITESRPEIAPTQKIQLRRGKATWLVYIMSAYFAYLLNALGPLMPFLRSELDFSYTIASLHFSAFAIGIVAGSLFGNLVIARLGQGRTLWVGSMGITGGAVMLTLSSNQVFSIASILVMGVLGSLLIVVTPVILTNRHPEHRAVVLTEVATLGSLGGVLAPLVIGTVARSSLGWRSAILVTVLILGITFALFHNARFEQIAPTRLASAEPKAKGRLPLGYWIYWTVIVLVVGVEFSVGFWGADYLETTLGLAKSDAATAMSIFLGAMLVGRFTGSRVAQRVQIKKMLLVALSVAGVGFLLYWLSGVVILALAGLLLTGLGLANLYPLSLSLAMGAAGEQASVASSRAALASGVAILAAPLLLGTLADWFGLVNAQTIGPVLLVLAAGIVLATNRK